MLCLFRFVDSGCGELDNSLLLSATACTGGVGDARQGLLLTVLLHSFVPAVPVHGAAGLVLIGLLLSGLHAVVP